MSELRAICFDLDGTLAYYQRDFVSLIASFTNRLESQHSPETILKTFSACEKRAGHITLPKILACLMNQLDIEVTQPQLLEIARELLTRYTDDMRLLPGAKAALDTARTHAKLALISNGPSDMQRAVLAALGITDYFDALLVSGDEDIGVRKPEPGIFELASERLGVPCTDALMIGDSEADITGAKAVGMKTLHVAQILVQSELAVKDLAEHLKTLLV